MRKFFCFLLICGICFVLSSCNYESEERFCESLGFSRCEKVSFCFPNLEDLEDCVGWKISVRCGTSYESFYVENSSREEKGFSVRLEKNVPTSVRAVPDFLRSFQADEKGSSLNSAFKVFGTVWPFRKELSELHAFSAEILEEFYIHSEISGNDDETMKTFISRFNWEKFCGLLEKNKNADENYNPERLNKQKILKSIEAGKFSSTLLKV